jgi:high-affinity Fe2+/Pb2+ permease
MKKRISAELISIAHRILKLKNHSETLQLQQEAKNLYDQLTILRFYEENFELVKNEIPEAVFEEMLEGKPSEIFTSPKLEEVETKVETTIPEIEPEILEPQPEEKIVVAELTLEESEEEALLETEEVANEVEEEEVEEIEEQKPETTVNQKETIAKQISFEDMLVHDYQELDFVKVDDVPVAVEQANEATFESVSPEIASEMESINETQPTSIVEDKVEKTAEKKQKEEKTMSLNDKLNKGINIGLNDRIAFEKKLFGGNAEDFNRVLSQLNTFDNFEEAESFIHDFVKPDYNNWEGNEEYEARFIEIVENKFK